MEKNLTKWDEVIEDIVERIRELRSTDVPPKIIVKGLTALKALGCKVRTAGSEEEKEYLRVRWSGSGERREMSVGPVDYETRKILKEAGLYLEATYSKD